MPQALPVVLLFAAAALSCGVAPPADPTQPTPGRAGEASLSFTASPEPVAAGGRLTYTLRFPATPGAAPGSVRVHLPAGAGEARPRGAGWMCSQATRAADDFQKAEHVEVACSSALSGGAPALVIEVDAPQAPGSIETCAEAFKTPAKPACARTTVVP